MTAGLSGDGEPVPAGGFCSLLAAAAADRPDDVLAVDDGEAVTAAALARRVACLAALLAGAGLRRGERVLVSAGTEVGSLVALLATLRAGLDPVLAALALDPVGLAAAAQAVEAAAMIGPTRCGDRELGETYLSAAAVADTVRGILTHGPGTVDGAADVSGAALDALPSPLDPLDALEPVAIATLAGPATAPRPVFHQQVALLADASALNGQAGIAPGCRLVSLLPFCTLAGLVGGPAAALLNASPLVLHGPFDARRFLAHCDAAPSFHLVAPAPVAAQLADAMAHGALASLVAVSRFAGSDDILPPTPTPRGCRGADLYAFSEERLVVRRRHSGVAEPPDGIADHAAPTMPAAAP